MVDKQQVAGEDSGQSTRSQTGFVVSDKMDKTAVVVFERRTQHSLYKKFIRRSTRIKVHDETNDAQVGDFVEVSESRPQSSSKSWALVRVVERSS